MDRMPARGADTPQFQSGLEGVVASVSAICFVDGQEGRLLYRGYDIHALAEHSTFEEGVYLLLHIYLPPRPHPPPPCSPGPPRQPGGGRPAWWRSFPRSSPSITVCARARRPFRRGRRRRTLRTSWPCSSAAPPTPSTCGRWTSL